jgi:hypothetical protein
VHIIRGGGDGGGASVCLAALEKIRQLTDRLHSLGAAAGEPNAFNISPVSVISRLGRSQTD